MTFDVVFLVSSFFSKPFLTHGHKFDPKNFIAPLFHDELPSDFHIIQDFLVQGPVGFTLSNPVKVSYKVVMQVWNTTIIDIDQGTFSFQYDGDVYNITPEVIERALYLPNFDGRDPDDYSNETLFQFVRNGT